jgi:hypothetical protein
VDAPRKGRKDVFPEGMVRVDHCHSGEDEIEAALAKALGRTSTDAGARVVATPSPRAASRARPLRSAARARR